MMQQDEPRRTRLPHVQELKWRRASAGGSAAGLATMNSAMDEADMKRAQQVPGLEQELRILGILETSVYACNCFKAPGGATPRPRSHTRPSPLTKSTGTCMSFCVPLSPTGGLGGDWCTSLVCCATGSMWDWRPAAVHRCWRVVGRGRRRRRCSTG